MRTSDYDLKRLREENDDLRYQLDERRRDEDRAREQRDEERREALKRGHPSNRLYNGEISNFREAIDAHIAALMLERNGWWVSDDEEGQKYRADFDDYIKAAEALRDEYDATVGAAERALFEKWAASEERSLAQTAGQSGLSGDYSPLAI
jgi:hypothetical protein